MTGRDDFIQRRRDEMDRKIRELEDERIQQRPLESANIYVIRIQTAQVERTDSHFSVFQTTKEEAFQELVERVLPHIDDEKLSAAYEALGRMALGAKDEDIPRHVSAVCASIKAINEKKITMQKRAQNRFIGVCKAVLIELIGNRNGIEQMCPEDEKDYRNNVLGQLDENLEILNDNRTCIFHALACLGNEGVKTLRKISKHYLKHKGYPEIGWLDRGEKWKGVTEEQHELIARLIEIVSEKTEGNRKISRQKENEKFLQVLQGMVPEERMEVLRAVVGAVQDLRTAIGGGDEDEAQPALLTVIAFKSGKMQAEGALDDVPEKALEMVDKQVERALANAAKEGSENVVMQIVESLSLDQMGKIENAIRNRQSKTGDIGGAWGILRKKITKPEDPKGGPAKKHAPGKQGQRLCSR